MKKLLLYIGIALAAIGCTKSEITEIVPGDGSIRFSAGVATRVSADDDCAWAESGDKVGLFTDQTDDTQNMEFSVATTGAMTSDSKLYPLSGENKRTFYAYHPYMANEAEGFDEENRTISIDNTAEGSEPTTPLLWSSVTSNDEAVEFEFRHKLAKVTFNLAAGGLDISDLTDVEVTLKGANAEASFDLETGAVAEGAVVGDIPLTVVNGKIVAYLIPTATVKDNVTLEIIKGDNTFTTPITTASWVGGNVYEYSVVVGGRDIELRGETYYIYTPNGLKAFADLVNGVNNTTAATVGFEFSESQTAQPSINGKLTVDVDLSDICGADLDDGNGGNGVNWAPIGPANSSSCEYSGSFDGGSHKVSGLYICAQRNGLGLFGYIGANGKVYNLGVAGKVTGNKDSNQYEVGGLVAWNKGLVMNCYSDVTVTGGVNTAGIASYNQGDVVNCYNLGDIKGTKNVGGIVGTNSKGGYVGYSYSVGGITGVEIYGGVVGWNYLTTDGAPTIKGSFCLNNTDYSIGQNDYTEAVGGITVNVCDEEYLKSKSFVTTMHNGSATYNGGDGENSPVKACGWTVTEDGYPTLNFGTEAETINVDISYNSVGYNINTGKGLQAFAALVNGAGKPDGLTTSGDGDSYFEFDSSPKMSINGKLTQDVDLSDICNKNLGVSWTPIGDFHNNNFYSGSFDGGGFEVKKLYINTEEYLFCGLFGAVMTTDTDNPAEIKNLGVSGEIMNDSNADSACSAGIVGYIQGGSIKRCYNTCTVYGNSACGGISGSCISADITECYNSGTVTFYYDNEYASSGGIAGFIDSSNSTDCNIINCYNRGNIRGASNIGGIVGRFSSLASLSFNHNIKYCYSAGSVRNNGDDRIGGVIGGSYDTNDVIDASYCYYDKDVVGSGTDSGLEVVPESAIGYYGNDDPIIDGGATVTGLSTKIMTADVYADADADTGTSLISRLNTDIDDEADQVWEKRDGDYKYPLLKWQK